MAAKRDWFIRVSQAWEHAETESSRVDDAVELFFGSILQEVRGHRHRRKALLATFRNNSRVGSKSFRVIAPQVLKALVAWATGDFPTAETVLARLSRIPQTPQKVSVKPIVRCVCAHALVWQAACATRSEELKRAEQLLGKAEAIQKDEPWPNCRGWLHAERGRLAFWRNQITVAYRHYAQAEETFLRTHNQFGLANVCEGLARIEIHQGLYASALQKLMRAESWGEPEDYLGQIKRLYHAGRIYRYQGDLTGAASYLETSLELLIAHVDNDRWEAHVRDVLGDVYLLRGDIHRARIQFRAPVFNKDDPVFRLRRQYRAAKLAIVESRPLRHKTLQQAVKRVLQTCDELIRKSKHQMLAEKALRLTGEAHELLGDYQSAVKALESAADQFARSRAHWYVAECLQHAGRLCFESGDVERAAMNFMRSFQSAVDDCQRRTVLESLSSRFQKLDAQRVCALLADLLQQREVLRRERDDVLASSSAYQELLSGMLQDISLVGGLRHIGVGLEMLKSPSNIGEAESEIRQGYDRTCRATTIVRELADSFTISPDPITWCTAEDMRITSRTSLTAAPDEPEWEQWGMFCQSTVLRQSLSLLVAFATERGITHSSSIRLDQQLKELVLNVKISGGQLPSSFNLFAGTLAMCEMDDWNLDAKQFAKLMGAVRFLQSVGGSVRFDPVTAKGRKSANTSFQLSIVIPADLRPPNLS